MKLLPRFWKKTLASLGLKWVTPTKKKRRKNSQALEFGPLEPRKLLARGYTPPPLPDPDPTPPPVVVSGPETTEEDPSLVSDQIPDVRVANIDLVDPGTIVDGDLAYASPVLTGTVEGDFTTYPRLLIQFDLEATGADVIGGLFSSDASVIIENPSLDASFEIDPANPANPGNSNSFQSTPGWKNIAYRVVPIDETGQVLVDSEDRMLASAWESIGFQLIDPAEGPARVVDIALANDTDDPTDQQTQDPRIEVVVHGEFLASHSYRLEFEYSHDGQTHTDHVDVPEIGTVNYNPLDNNSDLAYDEVTVALDYRLMSSTDGGTTWTQVSSDQFSFGNLPILEASIGELNEVLESPYRGGDRLVSGFLIDTVQDTNVPYLVDLEVGIPDENGVVTFHEEGETAVRFDETEERFEYTHIVIEADSVVQVRARVKQWILGEYKYSPWVVTSVQEPQPFDLASVNLEEEPEREGTDVRGPGLAPKIIGLLEGAPTVEALEDNSETEDPLDYRELSNVRIEVYYRETAPDENSVANDSVQTDAFGHFEIRPDELSLGTNQAWIRSVLELGNGKTFYGEAQSVSIEVESVELPSLSIELLDSEAVEHTDETTGETYWSTSDPRISGTLTSTDTSLHTYQVAVEYAYDTPDVDSDVTLRSYADYEDKTSYYPILAGHEGVTIKVRARIAFFHVQLGEEIYSDWTEISIQLDATAHEASTISDLSVLGSRETNASDQAVIHGDSARIAGTVDFPDDSPTAVTVQFRNSATGAVLGQTTTSSSGRFVYSLDSLSVGTQSIDVVVLDWNYQTATVEAGPATNLTFEVQAQQPVVVDEFELHSDTGASSSDGATSNPTLIGKLSGEGRIAGVQVALTRNDGQEVIVTTDSSGRFIYRGEDFIAGQTYTYQARRATWDAVLGSYTYGTPSANDVTFQYAAQSGSRATIGAVGLTDSSDDNVDSTTGQVKDLALRGRINTEGRLDGVVVEVDFNGDGVVDDLVRTDGYGEFVFRPGSLNAGSVTPQVRVNETSYDSGSWIALPTYDFQPVVQSGPVVATFSQSAGDSPRVTGTISGDFSNVVVDILINHEGQDIVVAQVDVDEQGNFEYLVAAPQVGEALQFKARARVASSGRWSYGEQLSTIFNYQPTTYIDQINLKTDTVTGGTGSVTDGVSDDATLLIQVAGAGSATTVALEIQRDGGEVETVDVPVTAGLGEYTQDELGLGYHSVRVRVAGSDDTPWQQINFIFESDSTRVDSLTLAQELTSLDTNWQTAEYESSTSNDEDFDFQLTQAQETRDTDVEAANETLKQQKLIAEAVYEAAMTATRQDFEANVPESLRRFELDPFTWPDDPTKIPFEIPESEKPYEIPLDGPSFQLTKDRLYNQDIQDATRQFRRQEKILQDNLKADLAEAKTDWEADLATLKTTRNADLQTANQEYQTNRKSINQDTSAFATIQETLQTADDEYEDALREHESQYEQTITNLDAGYTAALLNLQAEEQAQLPTPRTGSWTVIKPILEQFSENFKTLHNEYHKLRSEAMWEWKTQDAEALSVLEKAQSTAQADTSRLLRQLQHDKLVAERGHWLTYKTEVARIHKDYTKDVATRTKDYRLEVAVDQRGFQFSVVIATHVRDNATANARLHAVERWDAGLNTDWSAYQLKLAQSQNTYQIGVNHENRVAAIELASKEYSISTLNSKLRGLAVTGGGLGFSSQAEFAETLAVELAQASHDLKVDASAARNQRDQELATVWQERRDAWSDAEHEFKVADATADRDLYQKNLRTEAEFKTQLVHPSYYGRTWYYTQYALIASPQGFAHRMHSPTELNQILVDLNLEKENHKREFYTEVANAQKTYDEATIDADKAWRNNSSKTYRDALTLEATSESEISGWYSVRDSWKTAVQNARGKFTQDLTANSGYLSVWLAKTSAQAEVAASGVNDTWKTNVLKELVGEQPAAGSSITLGGKWLRDLNALSEFRQDVIEDAILAGEISEARGNRETTRNDDLSNSRQQYFEDLATIYWTRFETRQTASDTYTDSVYGPNGAFVQRAQAIADAQDALAEQRLEALHRIAISGQEKIHESAIANELHDFHETRAEEIAERAGTIVAAIHTRSIAMIDTNLFAQYTGAIIYEAATNTLGGEHTLVSDNIYLLDQAARDSISDTAASNFKKSVADANKGYEFGLAHARRTLVNDLGTVDLNNATDIRDLNTAHIGTWVSKQNELTDAIRVAEVGSEQTDGFQIQESNAWATSRIAIATANEAYGVSNVEISRALAVRDSAIGRAFQSDWLQENRDRIKAAHESHIASLDVALASATAAVVAAPTVANEKAKALAQYHRDTATEQFEQWKNWRTEKERYEAELELLTGNLETDIQTANIQRINDLRIYANRMAQADGTLVPLPEEISRDLEIERAKAVADRTVGRVAVLGELLHQRTIVQGKHDVDMMTLATNRDNNYANAEVDYVETVATAVHAHEYGGDEATLTSARTTASTDREMSRQSILDDYEVDASSTKNSNFELLGQKRTTFVADYTQKQIDFTVAMNAIYVSYDTDLNAFEAALVARSNAAGTTYTQTVTQARIDFATLSKQPAITHQTNLKNIRVASTEITAGVNADYHIAIATIDLDEAIAALGTSTDEALVFAKDKAYAYKAWLTAMKDSYVDYQKAAVASAGDLAIDLETASGTRVIDSATAQANFERDSQAANNQLAIDLDSAEAVSATQSTTNYNALDLAQANADKLLAEELIAAEVARDNTLDAIKRDTSLTTEEKATQTQEAEDAYDEAVAQAKHDRIIRTAGDGSESGRAIAWNEFQNSEADRDKDYDFSVADANHANVTAIAEEQWTMAKELAKFNAEYEYQFWIAKGEQLKRTLIARHDFDSDRFEEINNLGGANELYGLILQSMVEHYSRTLEGTGGTFGTTTTLQLIEEMVDSYESFAESVYISTRSSQDAIALLAKSSAEDVAFARQTFAKLIAEARHQYWTGIPADDVHSYSAGRAAEELTYDRVIAKANLDVALGDITAEQKDQQITDAKEAFETNTIQLDDVLIDKISFGELTQTNIVVDLEQDLADSVALNIRGKDEAIADARYGEGDLARTIAELNRQLSVLEADSRLATFDWLATSPNSPLLGLSNLLSYSGSVDSLNPNATILAWIPFLYTQAVADKALTVSISDAEKARDVSVAIADLGLANKTAELEYKEKIASNKEWADEAIDQAWNKYTSGEAASSASLPSEFARFDESVLDLSKVDLNLDEAITSWSVFETRWLRTRSGSTWYEGTETSNWRGGDPRVSTNDNLDHFANRANWYGEIDGFSDDEYIAQVNASAYIADKISNLNWTAFDEWITDAAGYGQVQLQSGISVFQTYAFSNGSSVSAANSSVEAKLLSIFDASISDADREILRQAFFSEVPSEFLHGMLKYAAANGEAENPNLLLFAQTHTIEWWQAMIAEAHQQLASDGKTQEFQSLLKKGLSGLRSISDSEMKRFIKDQSQLGSDALVFNRVQDGLIAIRAGDKWFVFYSKETQHLDPNWNGFGMGPGARPGTITTVSWSLVKTYPSDTLISTIAEDKKGIDDQAFWESMAGSLEFTLHLVPLGSAADKVFGESTDSWGYVAFITVGDVLLVGGFLSRGTKVAKIVNSASIVENGIGAGLAANALYNEEGNQAAHAGDFMLRLIAMGAGVKFSKLDDLALTSKSGAWDDLPLRSNSYGAAEQAAGSFVGQRLAASSDIPDGLYKFVVDVDGKVWLARSADDVPHSALIPSGQQVRGAGYVFIKNGRANVNGRSGHFMAEQPVMPNQVTLYDKAIRDTFSQHGITVIDNHVGLGGGLIRPPGDK